MICTSRSVTCPRNMTHLEPRELLLAHATTRARLDQQVSWREIPQKLAGNKERCEEEATHVGRGHAGPHAAGADVALYQAREQHARHRTLRVLRVGALRAAAVAVQRSTWRHRRVAQQVRG
eukprot:TRINITY_DN3866_c0_g1_i13.p2 TRINITY_DN3866_c0_g1~~TRINITY_DN3866_c0_g1_i13.p2  ORF type:complete len:121 (-),score=15.34 TRINITY_DN3866_c0_g1_i13:322-684(-)